MWSQCWRQSTIIDNAIMFWYKVSKYCRIHKPSPSILTPNEGSSQELKMRLKSLTPYMAEHNYLIISELTKWYFQSFMVFLLDQYKALANYSKYFWTCSGNHIWSIPLVWTKLWNFYHAASNNFYMEFETKIF